MVKATDHTADQVRQAVLVGGPRRQPCSLADVSEERAIPILRIDDIHIRVSTLTLHCHNTPGKVPVYILYRNLTRKPLKLSKSRIMGR